MNAKGGAPHLLLALLLSFFSFALTRSLRYSPCFACVFIARSADNMKKWKMPEGRFLHNITGHNCIVHALALNEDGVMASAGDTGLIHMWDYKTGYNFQTLETIAQPGSLESERGIFAAAFDKSGSRLITGEADKTIKIWREDPNATMESHPVNFDSRDRDRKKY